MTVPVIQEITVDNNFMQFREVRNPKEFLQRRIKYNKQAHEAAGGWRPLDERYAERCGLTGEPLKPEDGVYMVIGNHRLFPNRAVSKKLVDEIGLETAVRRLQESWKEAQKHAHWFFS